MQVGAKVESLELLVRQELISQAGCALAPYKAGGSELALATAAQVGGRSSIETFLMKPLSQVIANFARTAHKHPPLRTTN